MKSFNNFVNESESFDENSEIILYDLRQAREFKKALKIAQGGGTIEIQAAGYTVKDYDQENDKITVEDIGEVTYSKLLDFIENYIK